MKFHFARIALVAGLLAGTGEAVLAQPRPSPASPCVDSSSTLDPLKSDGELSSFSFRALSPDSTKLLRTALRNGKWAKAIKTLFGNYQEALPDWLVYIDSTGVVSQCVLADGRVGQIVRRKRFAWAMVFSDMAMESLDGAVAAKAIADTANLRDEAAKRRAVVAWDSARIADSVQLHALRENLAKAQHIVTKADSIIYMARLDSIAKLAAATADAATKWGAANTLWGGSMVTLHPAPTGGDTLDLRLWRRTIAQQNDPVLIGLIKGFAKNFGFDIPTTTQVIDSVRPIDLHQISRDPSKVTLWAGMGRMGLTDNSVTELALSPWATKAFPTPAPMPNATISPPVERIYTNIANVRERTFEIGMLGGVTKGKNVPTYDANLRQTSLSDASDFGTYVTVFVNERDWWFPVPWKPEWQRASVGGFLGTNINGTLGDQVIYGLSIGHVLSDAGISIGQAQVPIKVVSGEALVNKRQKRLIVGLDLRL